MYEFVIAFKIYIHSFKMILLRTERRFNVLKDIFRWLFLYAHGMAILATLPHCSGLFL